MNLFEWLGLKKVMEDTDPKNVVKFPAPARPAPRAVPPMPPLVPPKPKEHYRVGFDSNGMTTLTLLTDYGSSVTISMNRPACDQLIRMLQATYLEEHTEENDQ